MKNDEWPLRVTKSLFERADVFGQIAIPTAGAKL
jgi:hypothetical protein